MEDTATAPQTPAEATDTAPVAEATSTADEAAQTPTIEPEMFPADHVKELRDDLAKRRIKQRETVENANTRLFAAYANADGRLADLSDLPYSDAYVGEDGFIDGDLVTEAISKTIAAKPHLARRQASPAVPLGVREDAAPMPGLFDLINAARR